MKKNKRILLESLCLIAVIAAIAAVVGHQEDLLPVLTQVGDNQNTALFSNPNEAKEKLHTIMEGLPAVEEIDVTDETAAKSAYDQIVAIYTFAEEQHIPLTKEQETTIKGIIKTFEQTDETTAQSIPETGGVLSAGTYLLQNDLSLKEQDLYIPSNTEVVIDLRGHRLTGTGEGSVITVEKGGTLILKDSTFYPVFRGGSITGGTGTDMDQDGMQFQAGGGVLVKGTLQLQGGSIQNCTANSGGGVYICDGGDFLMSGGNIEHCVVSGDQNVYGGGVQVSGGGSFWMSGGAILHCAVKRDSAATEVSFGGGGIGIYSGRFTMDGGLVSGCSSDYHGGGIYVSDQTISTVVSGGTVEHCSAAVHGGGIYILNNEAVTMTGGTIADCQAEGGGAVCIQGANGTFDFQDGELIGSSDTDSSEHFYNAQFGGGIYVLGGNLHFSGGSIRNFSASDSGGGLYLGSGGTMTISNGVVTACTAERNGGGIYFNGVEATMSGGTISDCEAKTNGGGLYGLSGSFTIKDDSAIQGCTATGDQVLSEETGQMALWDGGGGIFTSSDAVVSMEGGRISGCQSEAFGGGIFSYGTFFYSGGMIEQCTASGGGGMLIAGESQCFISGGSIQKCHATNSNGGGISFSDGTLAIQGNPVVSENTNGKEGVVVEDNLYLPEGQKIDLAGTMTEGAHIGISLSPAAFLTREVPITTKGDGNYENILTYFVADKENTEIELDSTNQCLNLTLNLEMAEDTQKNTTDNQKEESK